MNSGTRMGTIALALLEQIPGFKIRASGLLGGHDLVRLLDERRDKAQGDGHHHRKLMDGRVQLFERAQSRLSRPSVREIGEVV